MKKFVFAFIFLPLFGFSQNSEAYTDEDLRHYLKVSSAMFEHQMEEAANAQRMQEELGISREQMEMTLDALKEAGSWEVLKPKLDADYAQRFDSLMTYRATLKQRMREHLLQAIKPYGWDEDYYQHLLLTIQADKALQERLIQLSKENE